MSRLLNMKQMMALFHVSRKTIYRWTRSGKLPPALNKHGSPRWDEAQAIKSFTEFNPNRDNGALRDIA